MIGFRPFHSFRPTLSQYSIVKGPAQPSVLWVSAECLSKLKENLKMKAVEQSLPPGIPIPLVPFDGIELRVASWLPVTVPTGRLLSNDRWTEYDEKDAAWAVPAGLARPEMKTVHAISCDLHFAAFAAQIASSGGKWQSLSASFNAAVRSARDLEDAMRDLGCNQGEG